MIFETIKQLPIVLASGSARRKQLLESLGLRIDVIVPDVDEEFHELMPVDEVPLYLSELKANAVKQAYNIPQHSIIIAADTIVVVNDSEILGKPKDYDEAFEMIKKLSGKVHKVITACTILHNEKKWLIVSTTFVHFTTLLDEEINYYLHQYQPYDKAGAYAIQELIGMIGIEKIDGDYYAVMGLPLVKVYAILKEIAIKSTYLED